MHQVAFVSIALVHSIIIMLLTKIEITNRTVGEADVLKLLGELLTQHINTFYHPVKFLQKVFRGEKCLFLDAQQMKSTSLGLGAHFPLLLWT